MAPDLESLDRALEIIFSEGDADPSLYASWRSLGEIGALAYASGLTVEEALLTAAREDVDAAVEELRVLAALRGWRAPVLP